MGITVVIAMMTVIPTAWRGTSTRSSGGGDKGRLPGQLADPWALVVDKNGRIHVIDTENHRVQRIKF